MDDIGLTLLAVSCNLLGTCNYLLKASRGAISPHPVTWFMWTLGPLIAFVAQLGSGSGPAAFITLVTGVNPLIVFVFLAFHSDARWKISIADYACGALAGLALLAYVLMRSFSVAVLLAILADLLASVPTYRKAWSDPFSETPVIFVLLSISSTIGVVIIGFDTFARYGFVVYLLCLGVTMTLLITLRRIRIRRRLNVRSPL